MIPESIAALAASKSRKIAKSCPPSVSLSVSDRACSILTIASLVLFSASIARLSDSLIISWYLGEL
ncbi:hypothetical protein GCM10009865_03540 [Aeromicrobium ponti]